MYYEDLEDLEEEIEVTPLDERDDLEDLYWDELREKWLEEENKVEYKKIKMLHERLNEEGLNHIFQRNMDGYQIIIEQFGKRIGDFVENRISYGLEAMGFDIPDNDVQGWLSVEEAVKMVKGVNIS